jgi:xylan 1,4-beta-xylosidase
MDADRDGFLDRDQFDNYAQLCADFVKIVNKDARFNVKYWEVMNEKDDQYFTQFYTNGGWGGLKDPAKPDRLKELITIYNKAAVAMKRIDPTIQVGGIGIARPDLQQFYVPFIRGTVEHLDFFTYHFYATGEASTSDSAIFDAPRSLGDHTRSIVQALKAASPNRVIPAMLGEYNISWTWETRDPRMTNSKGVVFDALSLVSALSNGATATLAWNEKDGIYGKTDDQDQLRLGGTFFKVLNQSMMGDRVLTTTTNTAIVQTFAVKNRLSGQRSLLVMNRSDQFQQVRFDFKGWQPSSAVTTYTFSPSGYSEKPINASDLEHGIAIPAHSVILLYTS